MPHKKVYNATIGPTSDKFGIKEQSAPNPFIVVDNINSKYTAYKIHNIAEVSARPLVSKIKSTTKKTKIISNTVDLLLSDKEVGGEHYFFKGIKFHNDAVTIKVDDKDAPFDKHFFYSPNEFNKVEYITPSNSYVYYNQECFDLFIWENAFHLEDIMALDGRSYSYSLSNGALEITCNKPNVYATHNQQNIFKLYKGVGLLFKIKPFLYTNYRTINGNRAIFEYDYSKVLVNIRNIRFEQPSLQSNGLLQFKHGNIVKDSIEIDIVDQRGNIVLHYTNANLNLHIDEINRQLGQVNIGRILDGLQLDMDSHRFSVRYSFVQLDRTEIDLNSIQYDLFGKKVFLHIKPTKIIYDNIHKENEQEISFTITNQDEVILYSSDSNIPKLRFDIPMMLGYGEGAYSQYGYSGLVPDDVVVPTLGNFKYEGTGYGEGPYSDGPFGGSYLKTFADISALLDVHNDATYGIITAALIDLKPEVDNIAVHLNTATSKVNKDLALKFYDNKYMPKATVLHKYINKTDLNIDDSIKLKSSPASIMIHGKLISRDAAHAVIEFDISNISNIDSSLITNSAQVLSKVGQYTFPLQAFTINNFTIYGRDNTVINAELKVDSTLKTLFAIVPIGQTHIGLGYLNMYPLNFIKI